MRRLVGSAGAWGWSFRFPLIPRPCATRHKKSGSASPSSLPACVQGCTLAVRHSCRPARGRAARRARAHSCRATRRARARSCRALVMPEPLVAEPVLPELPEPLLMPVPPAVLPGAVLCSWFVLFPRMGQDCPSCWRTAARRAPTLRRKNENGPVSGAP
jgi:hypothetical protein